MFHQTSMTRLAERVKRVAYTVSAAYILSLLIVATAVLGAALGGNLVGFLVALAFIGALSALVLCVIVMGTTQLATSLTEGEISPSSHPRKYAA